MIVTSRRDRNSGDAKVAGTSRSPLLRLPMRSEFFRPSKNQELLAPAAPDCAWFKSIEQDLRRRARLEAECLAEFNQPAALSTYQRGKSVRTPRATAFPALTQSGRSSRSLSSRPSNCASRERGSSTSRQLGAWAASVHREPSAETEMTPACISRISVSPPSLKERHTCALPSVGCPAKGSS